jgi:hypothetical protein
MRDINRFVGIVWRMREAQLAAGKGQKEAALLALELEKQVDDLIQDHADHLRSFGFEHLLRLVSVVRTLGEKKYSSLDRDERKQLDKAKPELDRWLKQYRADLEKLVKWKGEA